MFEKLQTGEKIHDAPRQPQTCSHPILRLNACRSLPGDQDILFSWFISTETLVSDLLS